MLNPSTADARRDDPTIRRCMGFARLWGYSVLEVRNLFAWRATDPRELLTAPDPTGGPRGDRELQAVAKADLVIAAWGARVPFARDREALALLGGCDLKCLGRTRNGQPRHPLYVRGGRAWRNSTIRNESRSEPRTERGFASGVSGQRGPNCAK